MTSCGSAGLVSDSAKTSGENQAKIVAAMAIVGRNGVRVIEMSRGCQLVGVSVAYLRGRRCNLPVEKLDQRLGAFLRAR